MRCCTGSQCTDVSVAVTWSGGRRSSTKRATAWRTRCNGAKREVWQFSKHAVNSGRSNHRERRVISSVCCRIELFNINLPVMWTSARPTFQDICLGKKPRRDDLKPSPDHRTLFLSVYDHITENGLIFVRYSPLSGFTCSLLSSNTLISRYYSASDWSLVLNVFLQHSDLFLKIKSLCMIFILNKNE